MKRMKRKAEVENGVADIGPKPTHDALAAKYQGKMVYIWKGQRKGRVGRVVLMSGPYARVSITGTVEGSGIYAIKREYLMR